MSVPAFIASQRYGLGSSPAEMQIINADPKGWLYAQLEGQSEAFPSKGLKTTQELEQLIAVYQSEKDRDKKKELQKQGQDIFREEMVRRFEFAAKTKRPLVERLVYFWSNHFAIAVTAKQQLRFLAGAYEREAIRPHIMGNFHDLLLAAESHPAMLRYLDNISSVGPNSPVGKRRERGLNENLAREILELHTLGVKGGYTQDDVISFAKIITGWQIVPKNKGGGGFVFDSKTHEPGPQTFLGKTYSQEGQHQGLAAFKDIADHPSTARFIAEKLARHFIADTPPESSIKALEKSFRESRGDLKSVYKTLIDLEEPWMEPLPKLKTPYELILSTYRLVGTENSKFSPRRSLYQSLRFLNHMPFNVSSPAGWPDTTADWMSPDTMMARVEWCHSFAQSLTIKIKPVELAQAVIGPVADAETLLWIDRAPSGVEGMALLLASPSWQRR